MAGKLRKNTRPNKGQMGLPNSGVPGSFQLKNPSTADAGGGSVRPLPRPRPNGPTGGFAGAGGRVPAPGTNTQVPGGMPTLPGGPPGGLGDMMQTFDAHGRGQNDPNYMRGTWDRGTWPGPGSGVGPPPDRGERPPGFGGPPVQVGAGGLAGMLFDQRPNLTRQQEMARYLRQGGDPMNEQIQRMRARPEYQFYRSPQGGAGTDSFEDWWLRRQNPMAYAQQMQARQGTAQPGDVMF